MSTRLVSPHQAYLDGNGDPLSGGLLYFYETGTTTPKNTYSDNDLATANTNPVVLNSEGRPDVDIWGSGEFKLVVKNSAGVTQDTYDPLVGFDISGRTVYADIATVKELSASAFTDGGSFYVSQYDTVGDEGGGLFYWDDDSAATADDFRTFALTEGGDGRFIRIGPLTAAMAGAKGDNSTDDTAAMLRILQSPEKVIDFEDKTYKLTTWTSYTLTTEKIFIGNDATIVGPTSSRFIKQHANFKSKDIIWKDWTLQVFSNLVSDSAPATKLRVIRGEFNNCVAPIDIEGATDGGRVIGVDFVNCKATVIRIGRNQYPEQDNWENFKLAKSTFKNTTKHPSSTSVDTRNILIYGKNHQIIHNTMPTITGQSTSETHAIYTKTRNSVVAGNIISDVTVGSTISAINIKGSAKGVTTSPQGYGCSVSGNTIDTAETGIRARCSDTLVTSNNVKNVKFGIETGSDSNDRNTYEGNYLYGTGVSGSIGLSAGVVNEDVAANDNYIDNFETSVKIGNQLTINATNVSVKGNKIKNTTTAFRIIPASGTTLDDILIEDNNVIDATTMFLFDSGGTPNDVIIRNNAGENITTYLSSTGATAFPKNIEYDQVLDIQTTDATTTNILGPTIQDVTAYLVDTNVLAAESAAADRASYAKRALIYRSGGGATIEGSLVTPTADVESSGATTWGTDIAVGSNDMRVRINGAASTTINWKVHVKIMGA